MQTAPSLRGDGAGEKDMFTGLNGPAALGGRTTFEVEVGSGAKTVRIGEMTKNLDFGGKTRGGGVQQATRSKRTVEGSGTDG